MALLGLRLDGLVAWLAPTEHGRVERRAVCTLGTEPATATQQQPFPGPSGLSHMHATHLFTAHPQCAGVARTNSKVHTMQRQAEHPVDLASPRLHRDECKSTEDRGDEWKRSDVGQVHCHSIHISLYCVTRFDAIVSAFQSQCHGRVCLFQSTAHSSPAAML